MHLFTKKEKPKLFDFGFWQGRKVSKAKTVGYCFHRSARAKQGVSEVMNITTETTMLASRRRTKGESPFLACHFLRKRKKRSHLTSVFIFSKEKLARRNELSPTVLRRLASIVVSRAVFTASDTPCFARARREKQLSTVYSLACLPPL